ncbi:hypothetical protein ACH3XW_37995 [Acanthocheilonema viteae]
MKCSRTSCTFPSFIEKKRSDGWLIGSLVDVSICKTMNHFNEMCHVKRNKWIPRFVQPVLLFRRRIKKKEERDTACFR